MGACLAVDEAAVRSRQMDREHRREWREEQKVVKLLLLGTGRPACHLLVWSS